jgi:death on curing protein
VGPSFLSPEAVLCIHDKVIKHDPSSQDGILSEDNLLSAIGAVESFFCYTEADDYSVAAAYAFHISTSHAFIDGNKRTGLIACMDFLRLNGYPTQHYDDDALDAHMVALNVHKTTRADFARFLRG